MDPKQRFTDRAENYARYRWEYAEAAIQAVCEAAALTPASLVADIGAGTGLLARRMAGRARLVTAIEPNAAMRALARSREEPGLAFLAGSAEAIPLANQRVDLITVGQALHWFQAEQARAEFRRILKPGGWLAVLGNRGTDPTYNKALDALRSKAYGWDTSDENKGPGKPVAFYLGEGGFREMEFPTVASLTWQAFLGGLASHSHAPQQDHPLYMKFEVKAREIFDRFSLDGVLHVAYASKVSLGQVQS
jgi:SAM-dependent methyltransferase